MFYNINEYREAKKKFYEDMLKLYGPYRFFITLSFQHLIDDAKGIDFADIYWRRTHKKIFEKNKQSPVKSINGYAVLEHKPIYEYGRDNCHFHFLVKDHPVLPRDSLEAMEQLETISWKVVRSFKTNDGKALVSADDKGVYVKGAYDSGATDYLFKDAWKLSWKREERLFFLDKEGIVASGPSASDELF